MTFYDVHRVGVQGGQPVQGLVIVLHHTAQQEEEEGEGLDAR